MTMKMCARVAFSAALLALAPTAARADWFVQPFAGINAGGATTKESAAIGVSGGWVGGWFGGEAESTWSPWFFDSDGGFRTKHRAATYTGTGLVGPRLGGTRPYGLFGLGVIRSEIAEVGGLASVADTRPVWHAGGGVMHDIGKWAVRGDARYIRSMDDQEAVGNVFPERLAEFDYWRVTGGVVFKW